MYTRVYFRFCELKRICYCNFPMSQLNSMRVPARHAPWLAYLGMRWYLSIYIAKSIATALVTSSLHYCNCLFLNIAFKNIKKLQRVQHCIPSVVNRSSRFTRSMPLQKSLHWLPVQYRIIWSVLLLNMHFRFFH